MKNNSIQNATTRARICRDMYRPSSNFGRVLKSILSVIVVGQSTIITSSYKRRS